MMMSRWMTDGLLRIAAGGGGPERGRRGPRGFVGRVVVGVRCRCIIRDGVVFFFFLFPFVLAPSFSSLSPLLFAGYSWILWVM